MKSLKYLFLLSSAILLTSGCDSADDSSPNTFFVSYQKQVLINEIANSLSCGGATEYSLGHPTYIAEFEAVDNASSYTGRVLRKDGTYAADMVITTSDIGNGNLRYTQGVGSISVFLTCSQSDAMNEQQDRLDFMDDVGHQGIEITAVL
ncbi:MAG: hypothetical protein HKN43_14015 [Rhodothermales bacterium]|nr:hypothetical protein [Rhodothermales bacterium]